MSTFVNEINTTETLTQLIAREETQRRLTQEEEKALCLRVMAGGADANAAADELVLCNLRLVPHIAKKYLGLLEKEDLISFGILGLTKAARQYDYRKECRFSSYACVAIAHEIKRGIDESRYFVRIPGYMQKKLFEIETAAAKYETEHGTAPNDRQLSEITGYTTDEIKDIYEARLHISSLDAPLNEDGDDSLADLIADEDSDPMEKANIAFLMEKLKMYMALYLNDKERFVLKYLFGLDGVGAHTLEETGNMMGLTRERARQIKEKALSKLRRKSEFVATFKDFVA